MSAPAVTIMRLPLTLPCPVPVVPGTGDTMRDGNPIPLTERTEKCAVDAAWMMGAQIVCDVHLRVACELTGIDFDGVVSEAYGEWGDDAAEKARARAGQPWAERYRYEQSAVLA